MEVKNAAFRLDARYWEFEFRLLQIHNRAIALKVRYGNLKNVLLEINRNPLELTAVPLPIPEAPCFVKTNGNLKNTK